MEFDGTIWPPPPKSIDDAFQQIHAYEKLRAEMEGQKRFQQELVFLGMELHARRALATLQAKELGGFAWAPNRKRWLSYDVTSDYGQSVWLPAFWMLVGCSILTDILAVFPSFNGHPLPYGIAASVSITNVISFLPYRPNELITSNLSAWAKAIADIHAIYSAVLLFLLGLALRNRFRMR